MDFAQETKRLVETWLHSHDKTEREGARRQIASLDDLRYFEPLRAFLDERKEDRERDTAYWMLESLLRRTGSSDVGDFLMAQVGREKKATVKTELLRKIAFGRGTGVQIKDATHALACLTAKMRNLRKAAVEALGSCGDPRAEDALLRILHAQVTKPTENGWFLFEAARSLSEIATAKALPGALELLDKIDGLRLDTRKADIKAMAMKTVCRVGGAQQADVYAAALCDGSPAVVKWHAMRALARYAQQQHLGAVTERVRVILSGKREIAPAEARLIAPDVSSILFLNTVGKDSTKTELLLAFEALARLHALGAVELHALLRKHAAKLTMAERTYLQAQHDELGDLGG